MNNVTLIFMAIGLISLSSCNQKMDANTILKNSESKTEIFNAIANNHIYMEEFLDIIQGNEHAMLMMNGDNNMMGNMMQGYMMQGNGMQTMMKDGKMMGSMMKMMHENGMMSEDCMESSMKMMSDKGMDMTGMNKMKK